MSMNWYELSRVPNEGLTKTAGSFSQEEWDFTVGDYQRWVVDTFQAAVYITKTAKMVSISLNVWNWHNSTMLFQDFWRYKLDEESKARSTFTKMKKAAEGIMKEYTSGEKYEAPTCMMFAGLRKEFWDIDRENLAKTNIPHINYARQKATYEDDWRSSIYGNRYPHGDSTGF